VVNAEFHAQILPMARLRCTIPKKPNSTLTTENDMTSRVLALDLDGTLLTPKNAAPLSLEALARAKAAGYQLIIVTGRHHVAIHPFYQALALDTPAICCNGTYLNNSHIITANEKPLINKLANAPLTLRIYCRSQAGVVSENTHYKRCVNELQVIALDLDGTLLTRKENPSRIHQSPNGCP
jgi:hydroxymethylpyrimidine pyrophosphatase-like HAD family hydrolase